MGTFSLDKYQAMKPLFTQAFDISRTVDILTDKEKQAEIAANIKKTPAIEGFDVDKRDALFDQSLSIIDQVAASELDPWTKEKVIRRTATNLVNDTNVEALTRSNSQRDDYNKTQVDRVKKGDIKDEDASIGVDASLLLHNQKGGTNPENGNYFANSTYTIPNVVDEQGIVKDIVSTPDGYRTENQSVVKYDPTTGEIFSRTVIDGKEYFNQGAQVGEYLYANNEKGIRDRHAWDAKKEVAAQLVNDGKYKTLSEAFVAVDQNTNGYFTNRLNDKVNEKKARFINNLVAQRDFMKREHANKQSINPANIGGSGEEKEPLDLVIDSKPSLQTVAMSDQELDNLDLDKFVQDYKIAKSSGINEDANMSQMQAARLGLTGGIYGSNDAEQAKQAKIKHAEFIKTVEDFRSGKADVLKKYGFNPEEWKLLSKADQDIKIKALIKQRKNISSSVGRLEDNNTKVYKTALQNPYNIQYYDHKTKTWKDADKKQIVDNYFNNGVSEDDAINLKRNSGFKSENSSDEIESWEEGIGHLSSKTPELSIDFSGYKVKPYFQFNFGDNNSSVRVGVSDITEAALVPIQNAFREFKEPSGRVVPIAPTVVLSAGGQNKTYKNLSAQWINGDFVISSNGQPTSLTLEKLAFGMISRQANNLNNTSNVTETKVTEPRSKK